MLKKISVFALLLSLWVGMFGAVPVKAEDTVTEWSNFGEYWVAQGKAIEDLPFEYESDRQYLYVKSGYDSHLFIFILDYETLPKWYFSRTTLWTNMTDFYASYEFDGSSWVGRGDFKSIGSVSRVTEDTIFYSDYDIKDNNGNVVFHKTKTGQNVSFEFALADMSDSLKTTLQGYDYYVIAKVPYRVNDWKSDQIMIAVSNGSKVVYRSEAYNQIQFTTGTAYEAGLSYIYCSECCTWQAFNTSKAYILGDTVATGGRYPDILWTNCDIYYEDGTSYGLTDEIYFEAYPYNEDGVDEEEPQEVVTDGFPRLFEVTKPVAFAYTYADSASAIVVTMVDGAGGLVTGVEYDASGNAWYKIYRYYNGAEYIGYVSAEDIKVGNSAPNTGDNESGDSSGSGSQSPTSTPSPTPSSGSSGSSGAGRPGSGTRPDTGGEATGGGGLDFIINLFTLIWQKICSIPMAVDGYSISLQQIFVYGALVSIVGGFIIKFIFRR